MVIRKPVLGHFPHCWDKISYLHFKGGEGLMVFKGFIHGWPAPGRNFMVEGPDQKTAAYPMAGRKQKTKGGIWEGKLSGHTPRDPILRALSAMITSMANPLRSVMAMIQQPKGPTSEHMRSRDILDLNHISVQNLGWKLPKTSSSLLYISVSITGIIVTTSQRCFQN